MTKTIERTWKFSKHAVEWYSAANGSSNKVNSLAEIEHVLQFLIAPPPQVDTIIRFNQTLWLTHTSIQIKSMYLCTCFVQAFQHFVVGVNMVAYKRSLS